MEKHAYENYLLGDDLNSRPLSFISPGTVRFAFFMDFPNVAASSSSLTQLIWTPIVILKAVLKPTHRAISINI